MEGLSGLEDTNSNAYLGPREEAEWTRKQRDVKLGGRLSPTNSHPAGRTCISIQSEVQGRMVVQKPVLLSLRWRRYGRLGFDGCSAQRRGVLVMGATVYEAAW
jgi:hypothetical protein